MSSTATNTLTQNSSSQVIHLAANTECSKVKEEAVPARLPVLLPDMFASFLAQKPRVNPHYQRIKMESEKWINEYVAGE